MPSLRVLLLWSIAYLAMTAVVVWGLRSAREAVIAQMSAPEAKQAWGEWRGETERPPEPGLPVARRPVQSDEPPALILMRDHFPVIMGVTLLIGSFLFAFLGFLGRGIWHQRQTPAN